LIAKGPSELQRLSASHSAYIMPFLAAIEAWEMVEGEEERLVPHSPSAEAMLGLLDQIYQADITPHERQGYISRYVTALIRLSLPRDSEFHSLMERLHNEILEGVSSLDHTILLLEELAIVKVASLDTYQAIIARCNSLEDLHREVSQGLMETFIRTFGLPRYPSTVQRLAELAREWGTLNPPLQLMNKLISGGEDYDRHVEILKIIMNVVIADDYYRWRLAHEPDPRMENVAESFMNMNFWRTFTREEPEIRLGNVVVAKEAVQRIRTALIKAITDRFEKANTVEAMFGTELSTHIFTDMMDSEVMHPALEKEIGTLGRRIHESGDPEETERLKKEQAQFRLRLTLLELYTALKGDAISISAAGPTKRKGKRDRIKEMKAALTKFLNLARSFGDDKPVELSHLEVSVRELESALFGKLKARTFSNVTVQITANPILIMQRGMFAEDLVNCFNLNNGVAQVATLIDDLASRNKMLAIVRVDGKIAASSIIKVRKTRSGQPVLHIERPLFRYGHSFEQEIARALLESKWYELGRPDVSVDPLFSHELGKNVVLDTTYGRGPTEYHEALFGWREQKKFVWHRARLLPEFTLLQEAPIPDSLKPGNGGNGASGYSVKGREPESQVGPTREAEKALRLLPPSGSDGPGSEESTIPPSFFDNEQREGRTRSSIDVSAIRALGDHLSSQTDRATLNSELTHLSQMVSNEGTPLETLQRLSRENSQLVDRLEQQLLALRNGGHHRSAEVASLHEELSFRVGLEELMDERLRLSGKNSQKSNGGLFRELMKTPGTMIVGSSAGNGDLLPDPNGMQRILVPQNEGKAWLAFSVQPFDGGTVSNPSATIEDWGAAGARSQQAMIMNIQSLSQVDEGLSVALEGQFNRYVSVETGEEPSLIEPRTLPVSFFMRLGPDLFVHLSVVADPHHPLASSYRISYHEGNPEGVVGPPLEQVVYSRKSLGEVLEAIVRDSVRNGRAEQGEDLFRVVQEMRRSLTDPFQSHRRDIGFRRTQHVLNGVDSMIRRRPRRSSSTEEALHRQTVRSLLGEVSVEIGEHLERGSSTETNLGMAHAAAEFLEAELLRTLESISPTLDPSSREARSVLEFHHRKFEEWLEGETRRSVEERFADAELLNGNEDLVRQLRSLRIQTIVELVERRARSDTNDAIREVFSHRHDGPNGSPLMKTLRAYAESRVLANGIAQLAAYAIRQDVVQSVTEFVEGRPLPELLPRLRQVRRSVNPFIDGDLTRVIRAMEEGRFQEVQSWRARELARVRRR